MEALKLHKDKKGQPFFGVPLLDDKMVRADRDNTQIFVHTKEWEQVDHIFIKLEEKKKKQIITLGAFLWRQTVQDFDEFVGELTDHDFIKFSGLTPAQADIEAWVKFNTKDLGDYPPDII